MSVNETEPAEAELLRMMLAEPQARVLDFRRRTYELEDIFMQIVEGSDVR